MGKGVGVEEGNRVGFPWKTEKIENEGNPANKVKRKKKIFKYRDEKGKR